MAEKICVTDPRTQMQYCYDEITGDRHQVLKAGRFLLDGPYEHISTVFSINPAPLVDLIHRILDGAAHRKP